MSKIITSKKIASNVLISVAVQCLSLVVNFVVNMFVPKYVADPNYSYWATFILYMGYVGILHFGVLDGIVLRYSQYDYDELNKEKIRSQFKLLLLLLTFLSLTASLIAFLTCEGTVRYLIILIGISITTKNIFTYSSYTFQMTNRINKYASLIMIQRGLYGLFIGVLLILGVQDFYWYCLCEIFSELFSTIIMSFFNKGLYFGKSIKLKEALKEFSLNIKAGIVLMLATWSAILLLSGAKMVVQWRWYDNFGKVSFAFSVTSLFLTFVTAISVVLFPSLKRVNVETLPTIYKKLRFSVSFIMFFAMIFFFPACYILQWWLPNYLDSLIYVGYLLPLVVFSSKVNLLTNTYLKVYRKEKLMMLINLISITIGFALFILCAYVFNSLDALLICTVAIIMLNSIASEIVVMKIIKIKVVKDFIIEFFMTIAFILSATLLSRWIGLVAYTLTFVVYAIINFKTLKSMFKHKSVDKTENDNRNGEQDSLD